jgi:hypothetical protein
VIRRDLCGAPPAQDGGGAPDATGVDAATPPPEDGGSAATDATTVEDCATCTNGKCSSEKSACAQGSECDAYAQCLAACTDTACFDKCGTGHATGKAASQALETCTITNCKVACGL